MSYTRTSRVSTDSVDLNSLYEVAGKSARTFSGEGVPTVTSLNGQPGTGIVSFHFQYPRRWRLRRERFGLPIPICDW